MPVRTLRVLILSFAVCVTTTGAHAHEFWIDPVQFTPKVGAKVPIVFRIGMNFLGDTYPYVRALSDKFMVVQGTTERTVKTLDGDDPAADVTFATPGLAIVAHQRKPEEVVFPTFAVFEDNLISEGLERFVDAHRARGRPTTGIREMYARCAKALVSVGVPAGKDRAIGMPLELIAEQNPYMAMATGQLPVRLLYNGRPIAGVLVKVFNRDDPASPRQARTDTDGRVEFDVSRPGEYLMNAVHMIEPPAGMNADWLSYWASLTFARK